MHAYREHFLNYNYYALDFSSHLQPVSHADSLELYDYVIVISA